MVNKGPNSAGVVDLAKSTGLRSVQGNHEAKLLKVASGNPALLDEKSRRLVQCVGPRLQELAAEIRTWPLWLDLGNLLVVHAGLEPGVERLEDMSRKVLISIRTWDGIGERLEYPGDPPWFDCVRWPVPVVFGHWATLGLVDRPGFKGLDTGCVYGRSLTGWCPEEERFYQVRSRRQYVPMSRD